MMGFVYFVRSGDFVKIGWSQSPDIRLAAIKNASPHDIAVVGVHPGSRADETNLHRKFLLHHHRREWFRWAPEIQHVATYGFDPVDNILPIRRAPNASALHRACKLAGGQVALAKKIGTSQSQVWYWLLRSKKGVPGHFVIPIEAVTGVPRQELRPDLYPPTAPRPGANGESNSRQERVA